MRLKYGFYILRSDIFFKMKEGLNDITLEGAVPTPNCRDALWPLFQVWGNIMVCYFDFILCSALWSLSTLRIDMDELPKLSCQFFMVHCVLSYPAPELLAGLRNFDISGFLSLLSTYPLGLSSVTINRQISGLFAWLKHHVSPFQSWFLVYWMSHRVPFYHLEQ